MHTMLAMRKRCLLIDNRMVDQAVLFLLHYYLYLKWQTGVPQQARYRDDIYIRCTNFGFRNKPKRVPIHRMPE